MMSCNPQIALSPCSDGVRRRSRACILAPVVNSNRGHVFIAFGFDLVPLNFEDKFFMKDKFFLVKFQGFPNDLRSDHDMLTGVLYKRSINCSVSPKMNQFHRRV